MQDPKPVNLMTTAEVRALGWRAEARDEDGHLISMHAAFGSTETLVNYLRESAEHGEHVTIFAPAPDQRKAFLARFVNRGWLHGTRVLANEQEAVDEGLAKGWLQRELSEVHFTPAGRRALGAG